MTDIAIVGIDCRFPKAPDPAALWDLLIRGEEGVIEVPKDRWDNDVYYDPEGGRAKVNTRYAGFLDDADAFDHEFFGFSAEEAEIADPQVRLLLQTAWRAVEDATLDPRSLAGSATGVYIGIMGSEWMSLLLTTYDAITSHVGSGNGYAMTANRISYQLDLHGPSMAIDTACSSALVAAEEACVALRAGRCDQALVGAVNMFLTPSSSIYFAQAKVSSPDGRCKPFSSKADGFGRSEGVGVLVLRRLEDAIADGLPIYAVMKGGAVNHGGRSMTVTAPNPHAQRAVIAEAYERAGVRPQDIAYVEAHGTGTLLGDRLEARALGKLHGVPRDRPCALGSIKGNIGHAEGAAGLAGLIKTTLALHHRVLPLSRYSDSENPRLKLAANGLQLVKEPTPLPDGEVLAGVSGFGLGGTNAHIVLATAPEGAHRPETPASGAAPAAGDGGPPTGGLPTGGLLTVSANDRTALRGAVRRLAADLAARPAERFAEVCWTSNIVKASGPVRFALPAFDRDRAVEELSRAADDPALLDAYTGEAGKRPKIGWTIAGASAWRPGMSAGSHERSAVYRAALATVDAALRPHLGWSVRDALMSGEEPPAGAPMVFAVAWATGRVLLDTGVTPAWTVAEGVGEHAAAALAGTIDLDEACRRAASWTQTTAEDPADVLDARLAAAVAKTPPTHVVVLVGEPTEGERTDGVRVLSPMAGDPLLEAGAAPDRDGLLEAVAALYRDGLAPGWDGLYERSRRVRHRLTPYGFTATGRFWWTRFITGGSS